jgi:hypothetical protein
MRGISDKWQQEQDKHLKQILTFVNIHFVFLTFSFYGTSKKNGGVAINETPEGFGNGPVDHLCSRAFCYISQVEYKPYRLLFNPALVPWGLCDPSPVGLTFFF